MEVKNSEAQGRHREVRSRGSVEERYGLMDKNRIGGLRRRTSGQVIAKSVSIKDAGGKSGGRVSKAVELIAPPIPILALLCLTGSFLRLYTRINRNRPARNILVNHAALHHEYHAPHRRNVF